MAGQTPLPRVHVIATGGTISNQSSGRLTVDDLIALVPRLEQHVRLEAEQFTNVASSALSLENWLDLARRINDLFARDETLAGIVVTSGTDTMEETAYFLHLAVKSDRPVVLVGSMRNPDTVGYDGPANLLAACRVAAAAESRGKGVMVVLNDEIHSAREVAKTDARRLDTFQSGGYGRLGVVDRDRIVYSRAPVRRHTAQSEFDLSNVDTLPRVDILMTYQGATGDLVKAAIEQEVQGVVIAAAGAGGMSQAQRDAMTSAIEAGVTVVVSTRTGSGRIAGPRARREGYVASDDLPPLKARVLLMIALTKANDRETLQRMFTEY